MSNIPVTWSERIGRSRWFAEYANIASLPGFVRDAVAGSEVDLAHSLGQALVLSSRDRPRRTNHAGEVTGGVLSKFLQRGFFPLATLGLEEAALERHGLLSSVVQLGSDSQEVGWHWRGTRAPSVSVRSLKALWSVRKPFSLDEEFGSSPAGDADIFDSDLECHFLQKWVPEALGEEFAHWFFPQASLDRIAEATGRDTQAARRVDFLFCHPLGSPLAIEIDGPEHEAAEAVDAERDRTLVAAGIPVVRIPNTELVRGHGSNLDKVREHCLAAKALTERLLEEAGNVEACVLDCVLGAQIQLLIARALQVGWLNVESSEWNIRIHNGNETVVAAIADIVRLTSMVAQLYGLSLRLGRTRVETPLGVYLLDTEGGSVLADEPTSKASDLSIFIENDASPYQALTVDALAADFVLRPSCLPVRFAAPQIFNTGRLVVPYTDYEQAGRSLTEFLQQVFRKQHFRELQGEAVFNVLRGVDTVLLLPTGSGKSIIYQLAGLLLPGITLVIDPIVALIEDQIEGLASYGIDRAAGITGAMASAEERRRLLRRIERGEYQFLLISPERLQTPEFRQTLKALAEVSTINIAVIDEAHCVSEWGHDFRPAYLNLATNLRKFGKDKNGQPPLLLALTGTASRIVLRNLLADLGIDRNRSDSLIRPAGFDRPELEFDISRTDSGGDSEAVLRGVLNALPARFGVPRTDFFSRAERNTQSGIVFTPFVNGRQYGVTSTQGLVRAATGADVTIFAGSAPKEVDWRRWEGEKRANAAAFKRNEAPVLVATSAFGMGIDKPNVRYTVHMGMPGSIEAFYQQAGRAGRDRRRSLCSVIFSEFDQKRTNDLLDPAIDLEELRQRYKKTSSRHFDDDITRALWFHLNAFSGIEKELEDIRRTIAEIADFSRRDHIQLPFWSREKNDKSQEMAIFRLVKVGVLEDYEVHHGSARYVVETLHFDLERCKARLRDYVGASQPAKLTAFRERLDAIQTGHDHELAFEFAKVLVEFTYDVIERSRRRMIQESVLLARSARSDQEIRVRLLYYLQEGLGAETIEALAREERIDFGAWTKLLEKIATPFDAGELRGICIRTLESYPDHPGLLLIRGLTESLCAQPDSAVAWASVHAALESAVYSYDYPLSQLRHALEPVIEMALVRCPQFQAPLIWAAGQVSGQNWDEWVEIRDWLFDQTLFREPDASQVRTTFRLSWAVAKAKTLIEQITNRYKKDHIRRLSEVAA